MKKGTVLLLCISLLLTLVLCVAADAPENFLYNCYSINAGLLCCTGVPLPDGGTVTVTIDGKEIPGCTRATAEDAQVPITYFCIVDQSSAFSMRQKEQQKQALLTISENMRPIDSMILGNMHESLQIGPVLTTKEARDQAIEEACIYTARGSDPYETIVKCLELLSDDRACPGLRCLIMFSDGIDDRGLEYSEAMAREAIRSSGFSYHTFSLVDPYPEAYARNNAARMESMAEESLGGVHVVPYRDKMETADAVAQIMQAMLHSSVIQINPTLLDHNVDTQNIHVLWKSGGETWSGSTVVKTIDLSIPAVPETEPTQPETVPETVPETNPETAPEAVPETTAETVSVPPSGTETGATPETTPEVSAAPVNKAGPEDTAEAPSEPTAEAVPALPPETIPETVPQAPDNSDATTNNLALYAMIIAGILSILVMIAIVILLSRKQPAEPAQTSEPSRKNSRFSVEKKPAQPAPKTTAPANPDADIWNFDLPSSASWEETIGIAGPASTILDPHKAVGTSGCIVKLVPLGHEDGTMRFFLPINTPTTVGRNARSHVILSETDRGLSGIHFELQWDGRILYLQDRNSTNGTTVNGTPQRPGNWVRLQNGSIIRAGAFRYRISATKSK